MGEYGTLFGVVAFLAVFAAVALHARSLWSMSKNREQAKVEEGWEARQRALALQLVRIGPQPAAKKYGGDSRENLYLTIFTDPQFRALLERHVIEVDRKRGESWLVGPAPRKSGNHCSAKPWPGAKKSSKPIGKRIPRSQKRI